MAEAAKKKTETETAPVVDPDAELKTFVLHEHKVTTIDDEEVRLPKLAWGSEMKIVYLLRDILKQLLATGVMGGAPIAATDPDMVEAAKAQVRIQAAIEAGEEPEKGDLNLIDVANAKLTRANMEQIIKLAEEIFTTAPEKITDAAVVLTGQTREWVESKLTIEDILGFLLPFLYAKREKIGQVLGKYTAALNRKAA